MQLEEKMQSLFKNILEDTKLEKSSTLAQSSIQERNTKLPLKSRKSSEDTGLGRKNKHSLQVSNMSTMKSCLSWMMTG